MGVARQWSNNAGGGNNVLLVFLFLPRPPAPWGYLCLRFHPPLCPLRGNLAGVFCYLRNPDDISTVLRHCYEL